MVSAVVEMNYCKDVTFVDSSIAGRDVGICASDSQNITLLGVHLGTRIGLKGSCLDQLRASLCTHDYLELEHQQTYQFNDAVMYYALLYLHHVHSYTYTEGATMTNSSMFDLEDCGTVTIEDCKTTSEKLIKGRKIDDLKVVRSEAGLNELSKMGLPLEKLNDEQLSIIIEKMLDEPKLNSQSTLEQWYNDTANFATLSSDLKCTIIGAILATVKLGYVKTKELLSK